MEPEAEAEQNLAHIHWSWPEAIAANPAHSLATPDLAMDYFAFSPFWDAQSNNSQLRTQRRVENPGYGHAEEKVELASFRGGFEYIVAHAKPPNVFVIHRRPVLPDGGRGPVTHAYFILQDKIYMSPNLYDVASTRIRNATYLLSKTFGDMERARPAANPRATGQWRAVVRDKKKEDDEDVEKEKDVVDPAVAAAEKEKEKAGPDWNLFHALASTRAALPELDKLAASPEPVFDDAAELRTMEAMAQAALGRQPPPQVFTGPPSAPPSIRATSLVPNLPSPAVGTPGYAPSPLRKAGVLFPLDSPAPL